MSKTVRKGSKKFDFEEHDEGQTKREHTRHSFRKKQRKLKQALRSKNLDTIELVDNDYTYY
jgi:hypothetical protein